MSDDAAFIDITLPFSERLPVWPGDVHVRVTSTTNVSTVSELVMSSHAGTHLDAPAHFLRQGRTVDELPLDDLIGPVWVADLTGNGVVTAESLDRCAVPLDVERLIVKANPSQPDNNGIFNEHFISLDTSAAEWLLARRIRLVGLDAPSVDPFGTPDFPVHQLLLGENVVIVENLSLTQVRAGAYRLICLPLRYEGGDGAPVRAVLQRI